jgi:hypothetical protein
LTTDGARLSRVASAMRQLRRPIRR